MFRNLNGLLVAPPTLLRRTHTSCCCANTATPPRTSLQLAFTELLCTLFLGGACVRLCMTALVF